MADAVIVQLRHIRFMWTIKNWCVLVARHAVAWLNNTGAKDSKTQMRTKTRWLLLPLLIAGGLATFDYHINPTGWYDLALFVVPLIVVLTILIWRKHPNPLPEIQTVTWRPVTRWQIALCLIGVVCFVVLSQAQGRDVGFLPFMYKAHHGEQFFLFVLGVASITWGVTGGITLTGIRAGVGAVVADKTWRWILLLMVVGLVVRVVWLETAIHYYTDETNFADAVTRLRDEPHLEIMLNIGPVANFTWVYSYAQYYYTQIFGATLANLRAVSVLIGVLTIPAVYLLGKWGFGARVGLLAAFLLTFDLPHIHYSRLALNNIVDPLLGTLMIALLWRGLQTGSRRMFALGGVFLGLTGYFYEGGRLLYPALIVGWIVLYFLLHNGRIHKRGIAIFIASALLITSGFYLALSLYGFGNVAPRLLQQRVEENFWQEFFTSDQPLQQLSRYFDERLNPPFLHIVSQQDGSTFYFPRGVSLVLVYLLPFFLIGMGRALYHWRGLGWIFPLWVILTILGNSLIERNDWTARFVVVFPALVTLTALGLDTVYQIIHKQWLTSDHMRRLFYIGCSTVLVCMMMLNLLFYVGVLLPDYNVTIRLEIDDQDAGYRSQFLPDDSDIYVLAVDNRYHLDVAIVQAYERHHIPVTVIPVEEFDFTELNPTPDHPLAFFILQSDTATLSQLQQIYGDRLQGAFWSPYGTVPRQLQFALYTVAAE